MTTIAVFRSCLRKEYRDQVIKMLRAVPGEYTRTSYRFQWIHDDVIPLIESGETPRFLSFVVDPELQHAFPVRWMTLAEPPVLDSFTGVYRFAFELGPYVEIPSGFDGTLATWAAEGQATPPETFVAPLDERWAGFGELGYGQSMQTWKESISFLTGSWPDFSNTVFFRPHGSAYGATRSGPTNIAQQSEPATFNFFSFNPHLTDDQLASKSLHVSIADVMGDLRDTPKIPRDGFFDLELTFLEPGTANVQVEVRPDEQFSAYVPLAVSVAQNAGVDPSGPRVLGPEWSRFLEGTSKRASVEPDAVLELFEQLATVFPGDPELSIQTGLIHLRQGRFAAARAEFAKSLNSRVDPRAVWWSFIAALRSGDRPDAEALVNRLDLSRPELFDEAIDAMEHLDDPTVQWFAELPGLAFGEDKALRLLFAMLRGKRNQQTVCAIVSAIGELNPRSGIREAGEFLALNPDWTDLRRLAVGLARNDGAFDLVQDDVELLLQYAGGDADEYLGVVAELQPLVHPQRMPGLLMSNAIMLGSLLEPDARRVALTLALMAAEQAASNGDFISAQNAIQFIEMNTREGGGETLGTSRQLVRLVERMTNAISAVPGLDALGDEYLRELATELSAEYRNRKVVVFGGRQPDDEGLARWRSELGTREFVWVGRHGSEEPNSNSLRDIVDDETTLIVITLDDWRVSESVRNWLRTKRVPMMRAMETRLAIYSALRALAPSAETETIFVPQSCSDAVSWAMANCPNLAFSRGADDNVQLLDNAPSRSAIAMRIKQDLETLNAYADDWKSKSAGSFHMWMQLRGYTDKKFSTEDAGGKGSNPKFTAARTFPVDKTADKSGHMFMPAHTKLPGNTFYPRIHFTVDSLASDGRIWVGYIGPHLENRLTN